MNMIDYDMSLDEAFLAPRIIANGMSGAFNYWNLSEETIRAWRIWAMRT